MQMLDVAILLFYVLTMTGGGCDVACKVGPVAVGVDQMKARVWKR